MTAFPTPFVVQREAFVAGGVDAHGNPAEGWSTPVDVPVFGWSPPAADREPFETARGAVQRDLDVYGPAGTGGAPRDRWTVDGVLYEAVGYPEDFTHGPWLWDAGVRISLVRVEG